MCAICYNKLSCHKIIRLSVCFRENMEGSSNMWIDGAIGAIKAIAFVCDIITYPVYLLLQRPWEKKRLSRRIKVIVFEWLMVLAPVNTGRHVGAEVMFNILSPSLVFHFT